MAAIVLSFRELLPVSFQTGTQLIVVRVHRSGLGENNNVYRAQCVGLLPKTFPGNPPEPIALHSTRNPFLRDRETEARSALLIIPVKKREIAIA